TVEHTAAVPETEIADATVGYSTANHGAQRTFRPQFQAIRIFKSADTQVTERVAANAFESYEGLLQTSAGFTIGIRRKVCASETQLALGRRRNGVRRQSDQCGLTQFEKPTLGVELSAGR